MTNFPDDHVVEVLRGARRPDRASVRRALVRRCKWLQERVAKRVAEDGGNVTHYTTFMINELAALVTLVEIAEARWKREDAERAYVAEHEVGAGDAGHK